MVCNQEASLAVKEAQLQCKIPEKFKSGPQHRKTPNGCRGLGHFLTRNGCEFVALYPQFVQVFVAVM